MLITRISVFSIVSAMSIFLISCDLFTPPPLCEDPRVNAYKERVEQLFSDTSEAAQRIGELLSRASSDRSLLTNDVWIQATNEQVQNFVELSNQANQMSPPRKEFSIFHELLKNAYSDYADGMALLEDAVLSSDLDVLVESTVLLASGDEKRNEAIAEFNSVLNRC